MEEHTLLYNVRKVVYGMVHISTSRSVSKTCSLGTLDNDDGNVRIVSSSGGCIREGKVK
jgi:hypothetical protein